MADLATIGFRAQTSDLDKADKKLNKLTQTGAKTEKKVTSLQEKFKSFGKNSASSIASIDGPLGGIASRISAVTSVATTGTLAMTAFAVAVTAAAAATIKGVRELDSLQVAFARSEALINATGGTAGKTAESLSEQAQEIAFATLASVEGIQKAQSIMLTFKSVSGSVFDDSIRLAQDMATVFGGTASSAATQLGKALQDPIKGISALSRVGVTFTEQQKEQIRTLTESGQTIAAQTVILNELKTEVGGVGEAVAGSTLSGSMDTIGQAFDNLTVQIATNIGALDTFKSIVDRLASGIRSTTEQMKPDTASEAADKAMDLLWEIAAVEAEIENTRDIQTSNRLRITVATLTAQRGEYLKYASGVSKIENKLSTERSDAILKSIELNKAAAEAAAEAAAAKLAAAKLADETKIIGAQNEAYKKWLSTITGYRTPLQGVTDQITKINNAIADGLPITENVKNKLISLSAAAAGFNQTTQDTSYQDWIDGIEASTGKLSKLEDEIVKTKEAIESGAVSGSTGSEYIEQLEDQIKSLKGTVDKIDVFGGMTDSIGTALQAMQGFTEEGSRGQAKLQVAIAATNAVAAIGAVINQGKGDPYSAFGRMAAMAASMAALGQSIGSLGGSFTDTAGQRQADQGTTIWGDKAESISNAIDTTANATDKLVGINTGMLKALQALQAGISGAAGISAGAVNSAQFTFDPNIDENLFGSLSNSAFVGAIDSVFFGLGSAIIDGIGGMLGGSSKITDKGVNILGGAMSDLIDRTVVFAYQETQSKAWAFGSTTTTTEFDFLGDASKQFTLVFNSIADSVFEGATNLGFANQSVTDAINAFNIEELTISLKDLDPEDAKKEIEAVFSTIFNNLSGAVIPSLDKFAMTGEELGETLARLSGEVSIADFAVKNLGINLGDKLADPNMYIMIADNLTKLTGGIELFAEKTASFIDTFAPETVKFTIASNALNDALNKTGLKLPQTTEGFFELMQTLDGSTKAGQAQIATLLNVQDTANDYYDLVEDRENRRLAMLDEQSALENGLISSFGTYEDKVASATKNLEFALSSFDKIPKTAEEFLKLLDDASSGRDNREFNERSRTEVLRAQDEFLAYLSIIEQGQAETLAAEKELSDARIKAAADQAAINKTAFEEAKTLSAAKMSLDAQLWRLRGDIDGARQLEMILEMTATEEALKSKKMLILLEENRITLLEKAANLASNKATLDIQLLELQGKSAEALHIQRQIELDMTDESLKGLKLLIFAEQNRITLAEQASQLADKAEQDRIALEEKASQLASNKSNLDIQLLELQGDAAGALAMQRAIELAATDESLKGLKLLIFAEQDRQKADDEARAAQESAASELESFNNSLLSLSDNLRGAIVGIYGTEVATSKLSLTAALESARLGDFSKALDLNLSNLNPEMEGFKSLESFNIEQAITANKLAELADLTAGTATVQDMTLTAAQEQVDLLTDINSNLESAYVPQQQTQNNDTMISELKAANVVLLETLKEANELAKIQNRYQADSADSLDRIVNVGVEIVA